MIPGLDDHSVLKLAAVGTLDPWRVVRRDLTGAQRTTLALAAGSHGDWDAVNAVLATNDAYSPGRGFVGGDLATLLTMPGSHLMSTRAKRECLKFCSAGQMLAHARVPGGAQLVVEFLEDVTERYCTDEALARHEVKDHTAEWDTMRRIVHGRIGAQALKSCSTSVAAIIHQELTNVIGTDPERWRMVLSLGKDWAGTLDELAESVLALTPKRH
jgi:hypothetical protein